MIVTRLLVSRIAKTIAGGLAAASLIAGAAQADATAFHAGTAIPEFGAIADISGAMAIPDGATFKISFDDHLQADDGALNRTLEGAARFINMHVANGVAAEDIKLAVVVHGGAVRDVITSARRQELIGSDNASADLIAALLAANVDIYVCGQSAVYYDVSAEDLLPGVHMALSAMTAHALLQQDGYSLNPF